MSCIKSFPRSSTVLLQGLTLELPTKRPLPLRFFSRNISELGVKLMFRFNVTVCCRKYQSTSLHVFDPLQTSSVIVFVRITWSRTICSNIFQPSAPLAIHIRRYNSVEWNSWRDPVIQNVSKYICVRLPTTRLRRRMDARESVTMGQRRGLHPPFVSLVGVILLSPKTDFSTSFCFIANPQHIRGLIIVLNKEDTKRPHRTARFDWIESKWGYAAATQSLKMNG